MMNLGRLKAIIAPVFLRLVRPRLPVYESFERALADTKGYEDPDIIQMVSEKTQALQRALLEGGAPPRCEDRQTAQDMLALCYASGGEMNVVDIGGACGAKYFLMDRLLPGKIGSWRVVDTPAMAAAGSRLFTQDRLRFFNQLGGQQ